MTSRHDPDEQRAVGAAPAGALTTLADLSSVQGPEDLPPSVAVELGEIVATHEGTWSEVLLRDVPRQLAGLALVAPLALFPGISWVAMAVGAGVGVPLGIVQARRQAPLAMANEHLKQLGIAWRARRKIVRKLRTLVGTFPSVAPKDRPAGAYIATQLGAHGAEIGRQTHLAAPQQLASAADLPAPAANTVVGQLLTLRRRVRWMTVGLALAMGGVTVPLLLEGLTLAVAIMAGVAVLQAGVSQVFANRMIRRQLLAVLKAAGLDDEQASAALAVLKKSLKQTEKRLRPGLNADVSALSSAAAADWLVALGAAPSSAAADSLVSSSRSDRYEVPSAAEVDLFGADAAPDAVPVAADVEHVAARRREES